MKLGRCIFTDSVDALWRTCSVAILTCAFLLNCLGCGGGTTGTGGTGSSQFSGRIQYEDGMPAANALVVLQETGDSGQCDANGEFAIESNVPASNVTLLVEAPEVQATATIDDIPPGPQEVKVEITVDKSKNEAKIDSKDVRPRAERPRPDPTRTPAAQPTPTLAATPDTVETVLPEETPSAVPTSEPSPDVSPDPADTPLPGEPTAPATPASPVSIRGSVTAPSGILTKLRVRIIGDKHQVKVRHPGTFFLRRRIESKAPALEVSLGRRSAIVPLEIVTARTARVTVDISVWLGAGGSLKASLNSIKVSD